MDWIKRIIEASATDKIHPLLPEQSTFKIEQYSSVILDLNLKSTSPELAVKNSPELDVFLYSYIKAYFLDEMLRMMRFAYYGLIWYDEQDMKITSYSIILSSPIDFLWLVIHAQSHFNAS